MKENTMMEINRKSVGYALESIFKGFKEEFKKNSVYNYNDIYLASLRIAECAEYWHFSKRHGAVSDLTVKVKLEIGNRYDLDNIIFYVCEEKPNRLFKEYNTLGCLELTMWHDEKAKEEIKPLTCVFNDYSFRHPTFVFDEELDRM